MVLLQGAALLDTIVLSVVSEKDVGTYGLPDPAGCAGGNWKFQDSTLCPFCKLGCRGRCPGGLTYGHCGQKPCNIIRLRKGAVQLNLYIAVNGRISIQKK